MSNFRRISRSHAKYVKNFSNVMDVQNVIFVPKKKSLMKLHNFLKQFLKEFSHQKKKPFNSSTVEIQFLLFAEKKILKNTSRKYMKKLSHMSAKFVTTAEKPEVGGHGGHVPPQVFGIGQGKN